MSFYDQIDAILASDPDANAIEFRGRWSTRRDLALAARLLKAELTARGLRPGTRVGLISRNRPGLAVAYIAILASRCCGVMIYPAQSSQRIAEEVRSLQLALLVGDEQDWTPELIEACRESGVLGLIARQDAQQPIAIVPELVPIQVRHADADPDVVVELLSSGTTGVPKRVKIRVNTVESSVQDAAAVYATGVKGVTPPPAIMFQPLGNVAGFSFLTPVFSQGAPIVLMEKFNLDELIDLIRRYRPARTSLPPASLRMILDRGVHKDDLASLNMIGVGAAMLDPALHDEFEDTYGIPLLVAYGATEFGGVVANWALDSYRKLGRSKRGSVGYPRPGVAFRIVDAQTGATLPARTIGVVEAKVDRVGPDWIHTTDLGSIDEDGYIYLHGRADGAINRGGFKVLPEEVSKVLRQHPKVADAIVLGLADRRLGQVPIAAVELREGAGPLSEDELEAYARQHLVTYQVPARFCIVERLPRNQSMKVSIPEVMKLIDASTT